MADTGALLASLGRINRRRTPWVAVLLAVIVAAGFVSIGDLSLVASITDFHRYFFFIAVHVTVILLRFWQPKRRHPFAIKGAVGKAPIAPVLALITIAVLVPSLEPTVIMLGAAVSGAVLYFMQQRFRPVPTQVAPKQEGPMTLRTRIDVSEAAEVADILRIDFAAVDFDLDQFHRGMGVELQHGTGDPDTNITNDDLVTTGKIALAHLNEIPDYYTRLAAMEAAARKRGQPS